MAAATSESDSTETGPPSSGSPVGQLVPVDPKFSAAVADVKKRTFLEAWEDFLYGYDFFISYRWDDGRNYAVALAQALQQLPEGFSVFLDSSEYAAGDSLSRLGNRAVRKTSRLVLVATAGVVDSEHVKRELNVFQSTGRRILVIDIDGSADALRAADADLNRILSQDNLMVCDSAESLTAGPSSDAIDAVRQSLLTELKRRQRQRAIRWAFVTLTVLTMAVLTAGTLAKRYYDHWAARQFLTEQLHAEFDETNPAATKIRIDRQQQTIDGKLLAESCDQLGRVVQLDLLDQQIQDIADLGRVSSLTYLNLLGSTGVDSLSFVSQLPNLNSLMLNDTGIQDEQLRQLRSTGGLENLILSNNDISSSEIGRLLTENPDMIMLLLYKCRNVQVSRSLMTTLTSHARNLKATQRLLKLDLQGTALAAPEDAAWIRSQLQQLADQGHDVLYDSDVPESQTGSGGV
ncbi:MAG: toll/interleukin-1 receptor domain-containing protein [Fuerstiella sp.]